MKQLKGMIGCIATLMHHYLNSRIAQNVLYKEFSYILQYLFPKDFKNYHKHTVWSILFLYNQNTFQRHLIEFLAMPC